jgi:hypothetical protein
MFIRVGDVHVEARAEVARDAENFRDSAEHEAERASAGGRRAPVEGAAPCEGQAARCVEVDDGPWTVRR